MRALDILPLVGFSLASSSLLVLNKLCLTHCRTPSTLASFQFFFATLLCVVLHLSGRACIEITFARVRSYLLYTAIFSGAIYTNMKSLSNFSVETVIVVRSCCPLLVAVMEQTMLGRQLPSLAPLVALLTCALGYAHAEQGGKGKVDTVSAEAAGWLCAYYVFICASDSYGKMVVSSMKWQSMWGPVAYSNGMSLMPMLTAALFEGELSALAEGTALNPESSWRSALVPLFLSVLAAISISFFGWRCRAICTATGFTILGIANKLLSTLASALLTDRPLSARGAAFLVGCLCFAAMYRPAPLAGDSEAQAARAKRS